MEAQESPVLKSSFVRNVRVRIIAFAINLGANAVFPCSDFVIKA